jgi:hypothetical protein
LYPLSERQRARVRLGAKVPESWRRLLGALLALARPWVGRNTEEGTVVKVEGPSFGGKVRGASIGICGIDGSAPFDRQR